MARSLWLVFSFCLIIMPSLFYVGDKSDKGRYHILCYSHILCGLKIEQEWTRNSYNLPEEVLQILPSDPFKQLNMARKITSIALSLYPRILVVHSLRQTCRQGLSSPASNPRSTPSTLSSPKSSISSPKPTSIRSNLTRPW